MGESKPVCFGLSLHIAEDGAWSVSRDECNACPALRRCTKVSREIHKAIGEAKGDKAKVETVLSFGVEPGVAHAFTGWSVTSIKRIKESMGALTKRQLENRPMAEVKAARKRQAIW